MSMAILEKEARKLVVEAGLRLMKEGLIARTWGNISARISDDEFIITPSGRAYETLKPSDLVKCRIADCSYEGDIKPSSEKGIHADAYRLRPEVNFIIHTHQFYATVVGCEGDEIVLNGVTIPNAEYGMPSTGKLRKAVAFAVEKNPLAASVLMRRHGVMCMGRFPEEAFTEAEALEQYCETLYRERVKSNDEILAVSELGITFKPPIDDLVQIAGTSYKCIPADSNPAGIEAALGKNNVCFLKNKGAVCTGPDREAVEMILKKGCAAALYSGNFKGMNPVDAFIQRFIYLKKYSRIKDDKN